MAHAPTMPRAAMPDSYLHKAPLDEVVRTTIAGLAILVMTAIHHIYGAMLFATPWRLHIVYISIPVALLILATVSLGRASASSLLARLASWTYALAIGGFAVGMIGVYEGGYNHLLPNLQYVLGVEHTLREGLYEPPDEIGRAHV